MKITTAAAAASLLGWTVEGVNIPMRTDLDSTAQSWSTMRPRPRVVGMATERTRVSDPAGRDGRRRRLLRRRGNVQATLDNEETLYFVNMTIGTPPQRLRLHLDTGSSDLWVNTPASSLCSERSRPCAFAGTYAANASSTYEYVGSYFNISYVDGSGASGDYATDTVALAGGGGARLSRLQFGVGYTSSSAQSILGVGYAQNEVQVGRAGLPAYRNLPAQMVADGLIASTAYSLWLNDLSAGQGSILFGGVDSERYEGSLQTLPIQQSRGRFAEFLITLTGVSMTTAAAPTATGLAGDDMALAVLLDSGSSLTYLPDAMVERIYGAVGAQYDPSQGAAYVPCSLAHRSNTAAAPGLTFTFSSPQIHVPMDELVLDLVATGGRRPTFQNGQQACLFGIAPAGSGTNVLGDTFLRSAYVVYDLDNNAISLAQTRFNATRSNVVEIGAGPAAVPGATAVTNPKAATSGLALDRGFGSGAAGRGGGAVGAAATVAVVVAALVVACAQR